MPMPLHVSLITWEFYRSLEAIQQKLVMLLSSLFGWFYKNIYMRYAYAVDYTAVSQEFTQAAIM